MTAISQTLKAGMLASGLLLLAGCESREERAEGFYQSALALMEEGDVDRALIELKNVLKYDNLHKEGRRLYADTVLERGDIREAYGQYLLLVEQYPDLMDVRLELAELALASGNWDEVERHGTSAASLAPDDPRVRAVSAAIAYREAYVARDMPARAAAAADARAVLDGLPDSNVALRILINHHANGDAPLEAIPLIDRLLEIEPVALDMHITRFRLLAAGERAVEAEAQLERMLDLFPEDEEVRQALLSWYVQDENFEEAEALLRQLAGPDDAPTDGHVVVVQFLKATHGPQAALDELERLIASNAGEAQSERADLYRSLAATLRFEAGQRDAAITEMQDILSTAAPSDQTRRIKSKLAWMLQVTRNTVGARALVEEVLQADPTNVDALKMRAGWAIMDDRPRDAIDDLRAAVGQAPRDPQIMTLMAQAHELDGDLALAGERLAAAVELSGAGSVESRQYAKFLLAQQRIDAARNVLVEARRAAPLDLDLISDSAGLALRTSDWPAVGTLIAALEAIEGPAAAALASDLRTARLSGQNRNEEMVALLEEQVAASESSDTRAVAMLVLARFRDGDPEGARTEIDAALAGRPDDPGLAILSAQLHRANGEHGRAEAELRALLAANPGHERAAMQLHALQLAQGQTQAAAETLETALAARPDAPNLMLLRANQLEVDGDIKGAIAMYDALYAEYGSNLIVANNLASLIGSYSEDPAELERAARIARRLRGRDIPALQDTWGWIAYRQGQLDEALVSLEAAAEGLPQDATVQYHLGMVYSALERPEDARRLLTRAIDLAGDAKPRTTALAREALTGLEEVDREAGQDAAPGMAVDPSKI